jgi:hypothetical protein
MRPESTPMPQNYKPPSRLLAILRGDIVFWIVVAAILVSLAVWALRQG